MDVNIGQFHTRDGLKLHYESWRPHSAKAALFFVHGLGDHCGRYAALVDFFTQRAYQVLLFDLRGHGQSEGRRVHARRFEHFLDDLSDFILFSQKTLPAPPQTYFLLGHSFGGQVVLNFLGRERNTFRAAGVLSPNLTIALTLPKWQEHLLRRFVFFWPTFPIKGVAEPQWLSRDPKAVAAYQKDPKVNGYVTVGLGAEIVSNLEGIFKLCRHIQTPLLFLHGSEDRYCSVEGTRRFYKELRLDQKRLKIYEGMYHELLNEPARDDAFEEIHRWFGPWVGG